MELKDIKELMKILKNEEMAEMKVRYGKIKLTLTNCNDEEVSLKVKQNEEKKENVEKIQEKLVKEEVIKSQNVGEISFEKIEKGMEIFEGMVLAKINTIGIETDVKSPFNGILKDVLVLDKSVVDYGKHLFVIELL